MNTMSSIASTFRHVFDKLPEIEFNGNWQNGTGYFDGAAKDASIKTACRSVDRHGRKLIIVPFPKLEQNLVFFERFHGGADRIVLHHPNIRMCSRTWTVRSGMTSHSADDAVCIPYLVMLETLAYFQAEPAEA